MYRLIIGDRNVKHANGSTPYQGRYGSYLPAGVNDMNKFAHLVINEEVIPDRKIRDTQRKVDALNHLLDACRIKNGKELKMSQTMWAHVNSEKPKGLTMILRKLVCEHLGG